MNVSHIIHFARVSSIDCMNWLTMFIGLRILIALVARKIFWAAVTIVAMLIAREQHSESVTHPHLTIESYIQVVLAWIY